MDWIRSIHLTTTWTTSVCTGSLILGAAGVSAGIDMALMLAEKLAGTPVAQAIQLGLEYDPQPPYDVGSPDKAPSALCDAVYASMARRFETE